MNDRALLFLLVVSLFTVAMILVPVYYYYRKRPRTSAYGDWNLLMQRLAIIDRESVALIARDLVDEDGERRTDEDDEDLEPAKIWSLIGGLDGLEILQKNCAVLIDIVFYLQKWQPEALAIAEQLRLNAREIQWHVERLKGAAQTGKLQSSFPDYAQRAVAVYYVMTRRVLALYEQGNFPGLQDLQRAL